MGSRKRLFVALITLGLHESCAAGLNGPRPDLSIPPGPRTLKKLTVAERQAMLRRAELWELRDTSSLDVLAGPPLPQPQRVPDKVTCSFHYPDKPLNGNTPKFECELSSGDVVKVKYGAENGEVYAEVAATRLFWAIGFKADAMFPATVTCLSCPRDPFAASKLNWQQGPPRDVGTVVFEAAIIEREVPGEAIETPDFEGWAWPELERIYAGRGDEVRAQADGLKLLAVFVQHSDSKPEQQKFVCIGKVGKDADGSETCSEPWLYVKDLGTTFGKATRRNTSKMRLADWSDVRVWKDQPQCVGYLPRSFTGTLDNPRISESGRRFLAERLARLSDRQLGDLFRASRVERRGETIELPNGQTRPATVDDWVAEFKKKRDEVTSARCPA
jgi:hypothetical protein